MNNLQEDISSKIIDTIGEYEGCYMFEVISDIYKRYYYNIEYTPEKFLKQYPNEVLDFMTYYKDKYNKPYLFDRGQYELIQMTILFITQTIIKEIDNGVRYGEYLSEPLTTETINEIIHKLRRN